MTSFAHFTSLHVGQFQKEVVIPERCLIVEQFELNLCIAQLPLIVLRRLLIDLVALLKKSVSKLVAKHLFIFIRLLFKI